MRLRLALAILTITSPVYAQTMGSSSGASSSVDINSPSTSTNRLITTPTIAAPGSPQPVSKPALAQQPAACL